VIGRQTGSPLKLPEQVEQQQDAAEARFFGEEFLPTKVVGARSCFSPRCRFRSLSDGYAPNRF
jgi:hypothetical protein